MDIVTKMETIIDKRKRLNLNDDYGIEQSWNEIIETLSENEEDTIEYLENIGEEELYWVSEVFEDISKNLQSERFIICLRKLDDKFPELQMTNDIDIAESYIENI